jgi:hypothetical protein
MGRCAGRTLHPELGKSVRFHDLNHVVMPETMQFQTRWSHRLWLRRDVSSAQYVFANSHGTASACAG